MLTGGTPAAIEGDIAVRIARANAAAEGNRSSGRLLIALRTTKSIPGGELFVSRDGAGAWVFSTLWMMAEIVPSNGRSPVSN